MWLVLLPLGLILRTKQLQAEVDVLYDYLVRVNRNTQVLDNNLNMLREELGDRRLEWEFVCPPEGGACVRQEEIKEH